MLKDAIPSFFHAVYIICGYTDLRYAINSLAAIIEKRYLMTLFVPNTLIPFLRTLSSSCGKETVFFCCTSVSSAATLYGRKNPKTFKIYRLNNLDTVTATLIASIINGKKVNAIPLEWLSKGYKCNGINLNSNTLAK